MASVVVPAHDESSSVGRLLDQLLDGGPELEVVVVCNGCSDDTADVARRYAPAVTVVEEPVASKWHALRSGDRHARSFPRVYVDADVEITGADVRRLADTLRTEPTVLAAGPVREVPLDRASPLVRAYYDVWLALPQVRAGLFGRGVVAVGERAWRRLQALPVMMADDLVMSDSFDPDEVRVVSGSTVRIRPPRTVRDLYRRRVRVATGVQQAAEHGLRREGSSTSLRTLARMCRAQPRLAPRVVVFLAVAVAARLTSRRAVAAGDYDTWLRDESSRSG
ncbi:glycosyltransferase [Ornithinimicrobium avium]|uniref:4,4'-diaponeurosporenoate glycosyltransferase n=1 Tax=Ornithinimicrobium avium TaxID=2283195 RepID=A0A345NSN3_9MICO|nr:glycosyltransferase [Ornithinimicrobium avium]